MVFERWVKFPRNYVFPEWANFFLKKLFFRKGGIYFFGRLKNFHLLRVHYPWCHCFLCLSVTVEKITIWWIALFTFCRTDFGMRHYVDRENLQGMKVPLSNAVEQYKSI